MHPWDNGGSGKGPLHERAVLQATELGCDAGESCGPLDTSHGTLALPGCVTPALWENRGRWKVLWQCQLCVSCWEVSLLLIVTVIYSLLPAL